jgi:hypothetical protein
MLLESSKKRSRQWHCCEQRYLQEPHDQRMAQQQQKMTLLVRHQILLERDLEMLMALG